LIYTTFERPDYDMELIQEWALDDNLYLMPQDEDLLLAEEKYLELVLEAIDTLLMSTYKQQVLFSALCVIVYDHSHPEAENKDEHVKQKVIAALNQRKDKLLQAEDWIGDYIKKVVFPQLDH
jgi:hypothetical protein